MAFRIHGFEGKDFTGSITRVNPAANAMTRQVEVLVSFAPGQQQPGVAGLYAEGRVEIAQREGLSLPADAIVRDGDNAFAWSVQDGKLQKIDAEARRPRSAQRRDTYRGIRPRGGRCGAALSQRPRCTTGSR